MKENEHVIGVFKHERDTPGTHRYVGYVGDRKVTQYVAKSVFAGQQRPDELEVVLRWKG